MKSKRHASSSVCQETVFPAPLRIVKAGAHPGRDEMGFHSSSSVFSTSSAISFLKNIEADTVINPEELLIHPSQHAEWV